MFFFRLVEDCDGASKFDSLGLAVTSMRQLFSVGLEAMSTFPRLEDDNEGLCGNAQGSESVTIRTLCPVVQRTTDLQLFYAPRTCPKTSLWRNTGGVALLRRFRSQKKGERGRLDTTLHVEAWL